MTFIKTLKNIFSNTPSESVEVGFGSPETEKGPVVPGIVPEPVQETSANEEAWEEENKPPAPRRVMRAPVVTEGLFPEASDEILIKAQPSGNQDQCLFMVNRPLFEGYSWLFPSFESAEGSPLAERLFSLEDVESVLVHESALTVTRKDKSQVDWKPLAKGVGEAIRELMQDGEILISQKIVKEMPAEDEIREGIQKSIDTEVNPGVAGHGGRITLLGIKGNTVTIEMGGGCQGCSAADLTLKQGIHTTFRAAVPQVGAIFDETDHSAGLNPYF